MLALALIACGARSAPDDDGSEVGRVVLVTPDELRARMHAAASRPRLFNFWATWCGPCIEEMPRLRDLPATRPDLTVVMVNLDLPKAHDGKVVPFVHKQGLAHLHHLQLDSDDPAMELRAAVDDWPDVVPVTIMVDRDGHEVARFARAVTPADLASLP